MNVQHLLAEYGSPAYVYDLARIRAAHATLRRALPERSRIYYSLKANPHPTLIRQLYQLGCRPEVSSTGELRSALTAGCDPTTGLYTGPGKTTDEIRFALERGLTHFSIDSPADLQRVAACAQALDRPAQVLIRVNPQETVTGLGLTMTGAPSQFGADAAWIKQAPYAFAGTPWAEVIGFHIYMGTNITAPETLFRTFEVATATAAELAEVLGIEPQIVDLGGGFGHPFAASGPRPDFSELREPLENLLDERLPAWRGGTLQIAFESGRYLLGDAGTLYCTVQDVKLSQGRSFVVLDTGIHHLGGMAGLRRVPRIGVELMPVGERNAAQTVEGAQIVGPLCTPLDHLAQGVDLPQVQPGDVLAIPNVGAYGLTGSLIGFLSRETPVEIVLDGAELIEASRVELIRRAL